MTNGRVATGVGCILSLVAWCVFAGSNPARVGSDRSDGANIPSGGGGNIPGRTIRDNSQGCGACHGSASYGGNPAPTVTISGPNTLAAGNTGAYTIKTVSPSTDPQSKFTGIDVASSNFAGLTTSDVNAQLVGNEITHKAPAKALSDATATGYSFSYQMPAGLAPGSARTLYGASAVGFGFGWNFSPNFNVVVPLGASGPSSVIVTANSSSSITLSWSGGTAAAYQINYQTGSYPLLTSDGYKKTVLGANVKEITGLSPLTTYYFKVWGMSELPAGSDPGTTLFSSNNAQVSGTTQDVPVNTFPFIRTGEMATARFGHTSTLLPTGKVLIAGGQNATTPYQSAELYDPATGTFTSTGSMSLARSGHTATVLLNGKVLITGGHASSTQAELYDPYTGTFSNTGTMSAARTGHTATLLTNGKVLVAGGTASVLTADLYDPSNGTFTPTLNMSTARFNHTATLLTNGKVLLAGGSATAGGTALATAEVFNPSGSTFTATTNNLTNARKYHTATALTSGNSGLVSLIGGTDTAGNSLNSTETYDTSSNSFTASTAGPYAAARHQSTLLPIGIVLTTGGRATNGNALDNVAADYNNLHLSEPRFGHTATVLASGRILIAGGSDTSGNPLASAEVYDTNLNVLNYPISVPGNFFNIADMSVPRYSHTATLLPNGKVLVAGGYSDTNVNGDGCSYEYDTAEVYDGSFTATTNSMSKHRAEHTATLLPNGKVLIAGGFWDCNSEHLKSADLYDPATNAFTPTGDMGTGRMRHTATLLANGKVLIAGGNIISGSTKTAELYDPSTGVFTATGSMVTARYGHTATLLPNGKVLIAGGIDDTSTIASTYTAELYDPNSGTFTASNATTYYKTARDSHIATLLPNGKVLVAEGENYANNTYSSIFSALLYDPPTDDYQLVGCCNPQNNGGRIGATSTLLPDGRVLIIGGLNENGRLTTAEVYDPAMDMSLPVADHDTANSSTLLAARQSHTATLLPDGTVLITGGISTGGTKLKSAEFFRLARSATVFGTPQPSVTSAPAASYLPAALTFSGTGFRGDSEASSGGGNNSAADVPLLRLQRADNDQMIFVRPSSRTATAFTSTILSGLADGYYRASIVSKGVPSTETLLSIRSESLVAPGSFSATGTSNTSISVTWAAVNGASTYEVFRSSDHLNYTSRGVTASLALSDGATSGTAYLYKVHAIDALGGIGPDTAPDIATAMTFTDDPIVAGTTPVKAAHITELRTAINAVRVLAGIGTTTFTDTLTPLSTKVRATHVSELRTALSAAFTAMSLTPISYTDPTLSTAIKVKGAHLTELRNAVK